MVRARKVPQVPGNPQANYPQRVDVAARQPVRAPTGMPYRQNQQLRNAQRAVPLPQAPPPPQMQGGVEDPQSRLVQALQDARGISYDETPFDADSQRPGEPLTAGVNMGPGPGPEVLGLRTNPRVASVLAALARDTGDATMAELARIASAQDV